MDCPACKEAMITLEYQHLEVDLCPACQGIWLDEGELVLLLGEGADGSKLLASAPPDKLAGEQPRRCPICRRRMGKQLSKGPASVVIDVCGRGHGLWFDKGELLAALSQPAAQEDGHPVGEWLRGMFAASLPGAPDAATNEGDLQ